MKIPVAVIVTYLCFSSVVAVLRYKRTAEPRIEELSNFTDIGDPLILTDLINEGHLDQARKAAEVNYTDFQNVISYSGYFRVNDQLNNNLFFWFFPAMKVDYRKAPVVLWLQGGPGGSSLYGLFYENGPFKLIENGTIDLREHSWAHNHSIIYIDNPVGAGFSFTTGLGYATNEYDVSSDLRSALLQFFKLFPELQTNEFYIAGESYAGKYIPVLAYLIHAGKDIESNINLKGLLIGNGFSDPENQVNYADYLYQIGLIDFNMRYYMLQLESIVVDQIRNGEYFLAQGTWNYILELFGQVSGFTNVYNFLKPNDFLTAQSRLLTNYLERKDLRAALHVGDVTFSAQSDVVYTFLLNDIMRSVASSVEFLLQHYRVLFYNGQLDIIVPYPLTVNFLSHLNFNRQEDYETAERQKWFVGKELAGYVKHAGNLTEVLVRNAGHIVPMDQPAWALDLISKFIANDPIESNN